MADIFGRHVIVQAAIIVMMVGSAICTGAPTSAFSVLLLGRAIQGIGCSGVMISVRTILADRVSLSEFASNWTTFILISGVSFGLGPLIGGYLTQSSWRWVFAINLPIAFISIFIVALLLRKELVGPQPLPELSETHESSTRGRLLARLATVDVGGQMLFLWGLGLLLLALTWGGSTYSWSSAAVLAPLLIGGALTVVWILYERSMSSGGPISRVFPRQRAMMPWELLSQRDNLLAFFINFGGGMAMFAVMYFADLYFTLVEGKSTSEAGLALLYYMPGLAGKFLWHTKIRHHRQVLTFTCSWCLHGHFLFQLLASSDSTTSCPRIHHYCCRDDRARLGNQCAKLKCCIWHDGTYWYWCRTANESSVFALSGLLSRYDGASRLPAILFHSIRWPGGIDHNVDGV